jgi:hypothetical protein
MLIFVLRPPRERPIASSSLPPFWQMGKEGRLAEYFQCVG